MKAKIVEDADIATYVHSVLGLADRTAPRGQLLIALIDLDRSEP